MGSIDNIFKTAKDYIEIFGRPVPIKYDVLKLSEEHRKLDALLRRHWQEIHPLSRDLFTSFANEFQYLLHQVEEAQKLVESSNIEKNEVINKLKQEYLEKIRSFEVAIEEKFSKGLNTSKELKIIKSENEILKEKIQKLSIRLEDRQELVSTQREEIDLLIDQSEIDLKSKDVLKNTISQSFNNVNLFTTQLAELETDFNKSQELNDELRRQLNDKEDDLRKINQFKDNELKIANDKYNDLKNRLIEITPIIEQIENENELLRKENIELQANSELKSQIQHLLKENQSLSEKNQSMTKLLELAESKILKFTLYLAQQKSKETLSGVVGEFNESLDNINNISNQETHKKSTIDLNLDLKSSKKVSSLLSQLNSPNELLKQQKLQLNQNDISIDQSRINNPIAASTTHKPQLNPKKDIMSPSIVNNNATTDLIKSIMKKSIDEVKKSRFSNRDILSKDGESMKSITIENKRNENLEDFPKIPNQSIDPNKPLNKPSNLKKIKTKKRRQQFV